MSDAPFIGLGSNPEDGVPDIPIGFGMELMQNQAAQSAFGALGPNMKAELIRYIQDSKTGSDAKTRIENAVDMLKSGTYRGFKA